MVEVTVAANSRRVRALELAIEACNRVPLEQAMTATQTGNYIAKVADIFLRFLEAEDAEK